MVLLTITAEISGAIQTWHAANPENHLRCEEDEPDLESAEVGKPITHSQILDLHNKLKSQGDNEHTLEKLLFGSRVYFPPPPPKPEPSDEYKALMARLRRDEEERAYERMVSPQHANETFAHRSSDARSFAAVNQPHSKADLGDDIDEVTYDDVHRQVMLILNFVLSIAGVGATLWVLARWWSTPARLFLTMGGSVAIGVAEVGLYYFYTWHLADASKKDKKFKERKEVVQTWVVRGQDVAEPVVVSERRGQSQTGASSADLGAARRRIKPDSMT